MPPEATSYAAPLQLGAVLDVGSVGVTDRPLTARAWQDPFRASSYELGSAS